MFLTLKAYGIGEGDEVIVPSNTFIATALAVSYTGAKPVLVEPRLEDYLIDENLIEKKINERTKGDYSSTFVWTNSRNEKNK